MAEYVVTASDGKSYKINGPSGVTEAQVREAVERRVRATRQAPDVVKPFERTTGGYAKEVAKGIPSGIASMLESTAVGGSMLLPDDMERGAREGIDSIARPVQDFLAPSKGYEDSYVRKGAEALGSTIPFLATAGLGVAAIPAGVAAGVAAGSGEAVQRAEAAGVDGPVTLGNIAMAGMIPGALEFLPPFKILRRALGDGVARSLGQKLIDVAKAGGEEALQEATSQVAQNLIARGIYDPEAGVFTGTGESAAYGGGVGGLLQMLTDIAMPGRNRGGAPAPGQEEGDPTAPGALPVSSEVVPMPVRQDDMFAETGVPPAALPEPGQAELFNAETGGDTPAPDAPENGRLRQTNPDFEEYPNADKTGDNWFVSENKDPNEIVESPEEVTARLARAEAAIAAKRKRDEQFIQQDDQRKQELAKAKEAAETAEIEALYAQEEAAKKQAAEQEEFNAALQEEQQAAQKQQLEQQKQDELARASQVETMDAARVDDREQDVAARRRAVLEPLVESGSEDVRGDFLKALSENGFAGQQLAITPEEEKTIARADDVRNAEPPAPIIEPSSSDLTDLEAAIPEKVDRPREAAQQTLPGVPNAPRDVRKAAEPAPAEVIDAAKLTELGIPAAAPIRRRIARLDLTDPAQRETAHNELQAFANAYGTKAVKDNVAAFLRPPVDPNQTEMFGPKGGIVKQKPAPKPKAEPKPAPVSEPVIEHVDTVDTTPEHVDENEKDVQVEPVVEDPAPAPKAGVKPVVKAKAKETVDKTVTKLKAAKEEAPAEPKAGKTEKSPYVDKPKRTGPPKRITDKKQAFLHTASKEEVNTDPAITKGVEKASQSTEKDASSANKYFLRHPTPRDALHVMAADIVLSNSKEAKTARKWVEENMGESGKAALQAEIDYFQNMDAAGTQYTRKTTQVRKAEKDQIDDYERENIFDDFALEEHDLQDRRKASARLHPTVLENLVGGDLRAALQNLAVTSSDPQVVKVASALARKVGKTQIEVYDLVMQRGESVKGTYDAINDIVSISLDTGRDVHTLLHEVTHAVTVHTLANRGHPVTRQLNTLYKGVKDKLDTAYGATSVEEFVAEAFSNPGFQAKLAGMNADGTEFSAWQKFSNTVRNFLASLIGMQSKPIASAKTRADSLIEAILAPAPDPMTAPEVYKIAIGRMQQKKFALNLLGVQAIPNDPGAYDNSLAQVKSFLKPASNATAEFALDLLPLNAVSDLIKDVIPSAPDVFKVLDEQAGSRQLELEVIKTTGDNLRANFKGRDKERKVFNEVVHRSTRDQVDPSRKDGATRYKGDADKLKDYLALRKIWNTMPQQDRDAYVRLRNTYSKMYEQIKDAIIGRIDGLTTDPEQRTSIKNKVLDMLTRRKIEPFFPLHRKGDFRLSYLAPDPQNGNTEVYIEHYETELERTRAMQALAADTTIKATEVTPFQEMTELNFERVPSSFVYQVMKELQAPKTQLVPDASGKLVPETYKIPNEVMDSFMKMVITAMPESSFAKGFHHREGRGVLGYEGDALNVYDERGPSLAHQLTNIQFDARLENIRRKVNEEAKAAMPKNADAQRYAARLNSYINFAKNPKLSTWSRALRSATFGMTLGFNVSSVVVNATNVPTVVAPYLGGRFGTMKALQAIGNAYKTFKATGFMRDIDMVGTTTDKNGKVKMESVKVKAGWSIGNWDFTNPDTKKQYGRYQPLAELAALRGQLTRSTASEVLEFDNPMYSTWSKINSYMGFMFHHGERMNRQVTMLAAYDLKLQEFEAKGKVTEEQKLEAAEFAIATTELTNSGALITTAPRLAQKGNGLGSIIMMYKRFGVSMYYMQFKMAKEALKDADPAVRRIAKRQIVGLFASAGLMAGIQGLPLYGIIQLMADMFLLDDDEPDFNTLAADFFGEGMYSGALNAITGTDVAARIGMTNLMFRSLPNKEQDSWALYALEQLGGPVFGMASRMETGSKLINEGQVYRGLENMLPSAVTNLLKGTRYATEGALTLRGDEIQGEVTPWSATAQALGFAPAEYIQQLERNSVAKKIDRAVNTKRTSLLRKYYMAYREGDFQEMQAVEADMQELSREHPGAAITGATIRRSLRAHRKTSEQTRKYNGVTISKNMQDEIDALFKDLDDE
jgi:hypothetical protein